MPSFHILLIRLSLCVIVWHVSLNPRGLRSLLIVAKWQLLKRLAESSGPSEENSVCFCERDCIRGNKEISHFYVILDGLWQSISMDHHPKILLQICLQKCTVGFDHCPIKQRTEWLTAHSGDLTKGQNRGCSLNSWVSKYIIHNNNNNKNVKFLRTFEIKNIVKL